MVITIIAILATIAFITLGDYPLQARDSVRKSDLKNIQKGIELYRLKNGNYPDPDSGTGSQSGSTVFGSGNTKLLAEFSDTPTDPTKGTPYFYKKVGSNGYILTAKLEADTDFVLSSPNLRGAIQNGNFVVCDFSGAYTVGGCIIQ